MWRWLWSDASSRCNNQAMADTGLFDVLAAISPERLLTLSRDPNQREWMVEARVALCEAVRSVAKANADCRRLAASRLVAFMNDAAFQVRRSAYRALSEVSEELLASTCHTWSRSTDVELRKRAAKPQPGFRMISQTRSYLTSGSSGMKNPQFDRLGKAKYWKDGGDDG